MSIFTMNKFKSCKGFIQSGRLLGEILVVSGGKPMFSNSTKSSLGSLFINEMFHCINTTRKLLEF